MNHQALTQLRPKYEFGGWRATKLRPHRSLPLSAASPLRGHSSRWSRSKPSAGSAGSDKLQNIERQQRLYSGWRRCLQDDLRALLAQRFTGVEHYLLRCQEVSWSMWDDEEDPAHVIDLPITHSKAADRQRQSLMFMLHRE